MRRGSPARVHAQAGFTYLGLLALVVLIGIFLAAAGQVSRTTAQGEREKELLFVGHQYRDAIGRFVRLNHRFPQSIDQLLQDETGGSTPVRYLRRLYRDPMTGTANWTPLPAPDGGLIGVASASAQVPLKHAGFDDVDSEFKNAETYAGWAFIYDPAATARAATARSRAVSN